MTAAPTIPKFDELFIPALTALKALGGSASNDELSEKVAEVVGISAEARETLHGDGPMSEFDYRLAWAKSYLKSYGALTNSTRGVWALGEKAEGITAKDVTAIKKFVRDKPGAGGRNTKKPSAIAIPEGEASEASWEDQLLDVLLAMSPAAFERLCQRILRESGFTRVDVTGRSGDGGIDGHGVLRMNLVSFQVLFQCKRWASSVGASVVRDFRGAMVGRADKGLIITTSTFTPDARKEAARDGAPAIDLVDGEMLCDLLKTLRLGVAVRLVEEVEIDPGFFKEV